MFVPLPALTYHLLPVVLALERYRAVWHPIEYHNSMGAGKPWRRVMTYVCPAVLFAVLVNLPKFFEVEFVPIVEEQITYNSETGEYFTVSANKSLRKERQDQGQVILVRVGPEDT